MNVLTCSRLTYCLCSAALTVAGLARPSAANDELDFIDRPLVRPEPPVVVAPAALALPKIASWTVLVGGNYAPESSSSGGLLVASFATAAGSVALEPSLSVVGVGLNQDGRAVAFAFELDAQPEALASARGGGFSFAPGLEVSDSGDVGASLAVTAKYIPAVAPTSRALYSASLSVVGGYIDDASYRVTGNLSAGRKVGDKGTVALAFKPFAGAVPLDGDPVLGGEVEGMYAHKLTDRTLRFFLSGKAGDVSDLGPTASVLVKASVTL